MAGVNSKRGTPKTSTDELAMVCLDVLMYSEIIPVGSGVCTPKLNPTTLRTKNRGISPVENAKNARNADMTKKQAAQKFALVRYLPSVIHPNPTLPIMSQME